MAKKIQIKRGDESRLPELAPGEPAITLDTERFFVGTENGNMQVARKKDLDETNAQLAQIAIKTINDFEGMDFDLKLINALEFYRTSGGGILLIPNGVYEISNGLTADGYLKVNLPSNLKIICGENVIFNLNNSVQFNCYGSTPSTTPANVEFHNGFFNGQGNTIYFGLLNLTGGYFKGIKFKDCMKTSHIFDLAGCGSVVIDTCEFIGKDNTDSTRRNAEAIQLDVSYSGGSISGLDSGYYTNLYCKNITVKNCTFKPSETPNYGGMIGVGMHGAFIDYHQNITIEKNEFIDSGYFASIRLMNVDNVTIKNNSFVNNSSINVKGISLESYLAYDPIDWSTPVPNTFRPAKNVVIDNNKFQGYDTESTLQPVVWTFIDGSIANFENIKVINNKFIDCFNAVNKGSYLIQADRVDGLTVASNQANGGKSLAFITYSKNIKARENNLTGLYSTGITIQNSQNVFIDSEDYKNFTENMVFLYICTNFHIHHLQGEEIQCTSGKGAIRLGTCGNGVIADNIVLNTQVTAPLSIEDYAPTAAILKNNNLFVGFNDVVA